MRLHCDRDICYFCGIRNPSKQKGKRFRSLIEIHHIVEKNEGGNNEPHNLITCCSNCHSKIHLELIELKGWLNFGFAYKMQWIDEHGVNRSGPAKPLPLVAPETSLKPSRLLTEESPENPQKT